MTSLPSALVTRLERLAPITAVHPLAGSGTALVEHDSGPPSVVHQRASAELVEQEARVTRLAHTAGVGAEVLDVAPQVPALVTRFVDGEVLTSGQLRDPGLLDEVATSVRRLHAVPVVGQPDCDPIAHRAAYLAQARERGVEWDATVAAAEDRSGDLTGRLLATRHDPRVVAGNVLCHGDLVPENLLRTASGAVVLLDLEYAGAGEAAFDLGNLVACAELDRRATRDLVRSYCGADDGAMLMRVEDWAEVLRHAWYVWVVLGDDLGPGREHWTDWAARVHTRWAAGPDRAE